MEECEKYHRVSSAFRSRRDGTGGASKAHKRQGMTMCRVRGEDTFHELCPGILLIKTLNSGHRQVRTGRRGSSGRGRCPALKLSRTKVSCELGAETVVLPCTVSRWEHLKGIIKWLRKMTGKTTNICVVLRVRSGTTTWRSHLLSELGRKRTTLEGQNIGRISSNDLDRCVAMQRILIWRSESCTLGAGND